MTIPPGLTPPTVDPRLEQALRDAGLIPPTAGLGSYGTILHTFDATGMPAPLSLAALAFIESWQPPPDFAPLEREELLAQLTLRAADDPDVALLAQLVLEGE